MSLIVNGVEITSSFFNDIELSKIIYNNVLIWESSTVEEIAGSLEDFEYVIEDNIIKITGWKGTLNGQSSTVCAIPNNSSIQLYNILFRNNTSITNIIIPNTVSYTMAGNSAFRNMPNLQSVTFNHTNITNMFYMFSNCYNLIGSPFCEDNILIMSGAYQDCRNLTGSPVCGNNVTNMWCTYQNCKNLTGSPVCGPNVVHMYNAYQNCRNLTGSPACGPKVTNMWQAYHACHNLNGSPVCGPNVTHMYLAYGDCYNLTGAPACTEKVTNLTSTYMSCLNLTGPPATSNLVKDMYQTYYGCRNLTGTAVCGSNCTTMDRAYSGCCNIYGNGYFYSNKINSVANIFYNRNTLNRFNLYLPSTGISLNTFITKTGKNSPVGSTLTWTNDMENSGCYYNTQYNFYIYPVDNVAAAREQNGD